CERHDRAGSTPDDDQLRWRTARVSMSTVVHPGRYTYCIARARPHGRRGQIVEGTTSSGTSRRRCGGPIESSCPTRTTARAPTCDTQGPNESPGWLWARNESRPVTRPVEQIDCLP